jgi:hypothetical protein
MKTQLATFLKITTLSAFLFAGAAQAERPDNLQPVPEPPPPPDQILDGEAIPLGEPQITIIQRENETVREYRLNGSLYAIKISPRGARPYYLIDVDGDGDMDNRFFDINNAPLVVPQWVIHRW